MIVRRHPAALGLVVTSGRKLIVDVLDDMLLLLDR
jgi:hypothetical protein